MGVKFFPHNDLVAFEYCNGLGAEAQAALLPYLTTFQKGKVTGVRKLRSLVSSFGSMQQGANYNDPDLKTLLTRVNLPDDKAFVVVLYGIHVSNGDAIPHVTVQMGDGTTEELKKICHFYVKYNAKQKMFEWEATVPPVWIASAAGKWRALNPGQKFS